MRDCSAEPSAFEMYSLACAGPILKKTIWSVAEHTSTVDANATISDILHWIHKHSTCSPGTAQTVPMHSLTCCPEFRARSPWPCLSDRPHRVLGRGNGNRSTSPLHRIRIRPTLPANELPILQSFPQSGIPMRHSPRCVPLLPRSDSLVRRRDGAESRSKRG